MQQSDTIFAPPGSPSWPEADASQLGVLLRDEVVVPRAFLHLIQGFAQGDARHSADF